MKKFLLLNFIILATFLQSCDERITPKTNDPMVIAPPTNTVSISSHSWQYNEVIIAGGGKTVVQFSRPNSIGLSSDFGTTKITYKADGSQEMESKGSINKGKWKFSADETQLTITDNNGGIYPFDMITLNKSELEFSVTYKKIDYKDDAGWVKLLKGLGLPETSTEYIRVFSFIPI